MFPFFYYGHNNYGDNYMCTCINMKGKNYYFGRNMDITHSFNEEVIITPRNYYLTFKKEKPLKNHFAFIGIGTIINNYPLYSEATNEKGISIAGLNFPNNCYYFPFKDKKINLTAFEIIPYILSKCQNLKEVKELLSNLNIVNINFTNQIKLTPLHFMISYKNQSIVIESTKEGLKIFDNAFNVLTNNPPFEYHQNNIINYINLNNKDINNNINNNIKLLPFSFGQGAFGLPGDSSSSSRFIRAFFNLSFTKLDNNDTYEVIQFFKCLDSVSMIYGAVLTDLGYEYTTYSSCINTNKGILYYKTYYNPNIYSINMYKEDLNSTKLINFKFINEYQIIEQKQKMII